MDEKPLFKVDDEVTLFELIYDADRSMMSAKQLGEAIIGMSTMLKIAGSSLKLDFEDVYIYPVKEGSVTSLFALVKRNRHGEQQFTPLGIAVVGGVIVVSLQMIAEHGIAALKNPDAEIMKAVDKRVLELCMNGEFRKGVTKVARPVNEDTPSAKFKFGETDFDIDLNNQYKFIDEDQEQILPELVNGQTVNLTGTLTRMNMVNNDMGFNYKGRVLSIIPNDPEKGVAEEYHQFLPVPRIGITGVVSRNNLFEPPKIKVIQMREVKIEQQNLFEKEATPSATIVGTSSARPTPKQP